MSAITINNLTKKYKDKTAVADLSFEIKEGELFALLGINGAGKSTTVKMLSCLIKPTSGDAMILGSSIVNEPHKVKSMLNVSPQESAAAPNLTVKENLEFIAQIYGKNKQEAREAAKSIMERLSLTSMQKQKAKTLSGGYLRRLSIAMAVITEPKILFLDEPTLGLDVIARRELWELIRKLKENTTIILTTHYMEEAEGLADRIGIIANGRLKAVGTAEELKRQCNTDSFEDAFVKISLDEKGK